ncbi:unnamed protein product [Rotaria sordida]|uniref:Uncharacterized protein n=1 Tax=Rotaria sordida TaxID=392033 RepID=A0A818N2I0_9BILA|nr:unnamed protein product [Rotaria sordida]CAF3598913.1 unnamed protein product [Rotaria sordida]
MILAGTTRVKGEVLASYNDSFLSTLQTHIALLKLSSQSLKMTKLKSQNLRLVLSTLTTDYGFEDIYDNLKVVRTSILNDRSKFLNENFLTLITPWQLKTTKIALNILRFIAASKINPQKYRMLSYFNLEIISPTVNHNKTHVSQLRTLSEKILALSKAVSAATNAWKDIVTAFKSSSSTTITRIVLFGFTYFSQKSAVLKEIDIPADKATKFINAVIIDYNLLSKGSFMLGLTYSDDFSWDRIDYLYSPSNNGNYRSLTLFKNAPNLLIIQTSKSYLGGPFERNKQSLQEAPHVLTMDEAVKLQQFFMLVAMGNLASTIGANVTLPQLN